ncbi:hypothetical protein MW084_13485, partial [Streptomyces sudanensis]
VLNPD